MRRGPTNAARPAVMTAAAFRVMTGATRSGPGKAYRALGRMRAGRMNRTESKYAAHLDLQKVAGTVLWWAFEPLKIRLADNTFYTPDFGVLLSSLVFQFHEVKGHWEDDARVKIKVASELVPFEFIALKLARSGEGYSWLRESF